MNVKLGTIYRELSEAIHAVQFNDVPYRIERVSRALHALHVFIAADNPNNDDAIEADKAGRSAVDRVNEEYGYDSLTFERAICDEARGVLKNPKLWVKDLMEWSTSAITAQEGEVALWLPTNGVWVAVKVECDKRTVA